MKKICSLLLAILMLITAFSGVNFSASAATSGTIVTGDMIIAEARKHLGKPYQLGKAGPDIFDCSGLTKYVFAKFGITLPHSTYEIYDHPTKYGTVVSEMNSTKGAAPGDLVCWYEHIGIYVGMETYNGTKRAFLIDAANPSKGVVEQPIWPSNGDYFILHVKGVKDDSVARGVMTTPTISLDKSSYEVANTVNMTWTKTSSETDFQCYGVFITNNLNGDVYYSGYTTPDDVDDNSFSYKLTVPGEYLITVYSVPYNDIRARRKMATRTISVGKRVDSIEDEIIESRNENTRNVDFYGWAYDSQGNVYFGIDNALAKGWLRYSRVWYFFGSDNTMQKGWLNDSGNTYYLSNGPRLSGKQLIDGKNYILAYANGAMLKGKVRCDGIYYIAHKRTGELLSGKVTCDGIVYIADKDNYELLYGRVICDGKRYIMDKTTGEMVYGKTRCDGAYFITNERSGEVLYGMVVYNNKNYILDKTTGEMYFDKVRCNGKWYLMSSETGEMLYGMVEQNGKLYILDDITGEMNFGKVVREDKTYILSKSTGEMLYGKVSCDGKNYIMNKTTGEMVYGKTRCDGLYYILDEETGEMMYGMVTFGEERYIMNKTTGEMMYGKVRCDGKWYITSKADGHVLSDGVVRCDGIEYTLDADGVIVVEPEEQV